MPAVLRDKVLWLLLGAVLGARILAMLLAAQLWPRVGWLNHIYVDVWTWGEFFRHSQSRLIPYVDFSKEYPVGTGLLYWWMSGFVDPGNPAQMLRTHALFMMAADLLNTGLFYAIAREINARRAPWATLLFSLNLTLVLLGPVRFESWVVATVLAGYLFHRRQKPLLATCFWSVGCWLKWFPALLIVAQEVRAYVVEGKRTQWLRSALVFLGVSAAFNLPFIVWSYRTHGSIDNWLGVYRFHLRRPLYWDTLLGVWQLWMGGLPLEELASYATLGLVVVALVVGRRAPIEYQGTLVCVACLVLNRVYSTQFHLWFYPLLLLAAIQQTGRSLATLLVLLVALDFLNVLVYPFSFAYAIDEMRGFRVLGARQAGGPATVVFSLAIILRAAALVALGAVVLARANHANLEAPAGT